MRVLRAHLVVTLAFAASVPPSTEPDPPSLELDPQVLDFGGVPTNDGEDGTVRLVNVGDATVTVGDIDVTGEGFTIVADNCSGEDVEAGESCAVTIAFRPPRVGRFDGEVALAEPVVLEGSLVGAGTESGFPSTTSPPSQTEPPVPTTGVPQTTIGPTPTPPPTTVPGDTDELLERLARCEADAAEAEVAFAPSLQMVVGEITDVDVRAVIGSGPVITPGTGPPVTVVPAVLRCEVEATLRGQGFVIDPADPQAGSFIDSPTIEWSWQVTPTAEGDHTLQFRILPVARSGDIRLPGTPVLFESTIEVHAAPASFWERADDVTRGIAGHPIVTGFGALAGIAVALAAGWRWVLGRPWPWKRSGPPPTAPTG